MFEFNGDWVLGFRLEEFSFLSNPTYGHTGDKLNKGLVSVTIKDERNDNPDPEQYQANTLHWLSDRGNQKALLTSILEYCQHTVYPHYKKFMSEDEYPECYPELKSVRDLYELLGLREITILAIENEGFAYFTMTFSSCLDHEHGISFGVYKNLILEHGEDLGLENIYAHKGISSDEVFRALLTDASEVKLSHPHPKYNKLKPWQEEANDYYPYGLFHAQRDMELIRDLDNGVIPAEPTISHLLAWSIRDGRENLIESFLERSLYKFSALEEALKKDRYDLTDRLIKLGADVNERVAQSSLFYETIGYLEKAISANEETNRFTKRLQYLLDNGLDPYRQDEWGRDSFFRIERIDDKTLRGKVKGEVMRVMKSREKR